jgi:hypothetical protein
MEQGEISKEFRSKIAHARLINGIYGAPAPTRCDRCVEEGLECRIYHPDLQAPRASSGSCANCRFHSSTCRTDGIGHRIQKKKASIVPIVDERVYKAFKPPKSKPGTKIKIFYYPVISCPRHSQGIGKRENFIRHMNTRHPDMPIPDANASQARPEAVSTANCQRAVSEYIPTQKGMHGRYVCPEQGCTKSPLDGYTRIDNFRR